MSRLERKDKLNKYLSKVTTQAQNQYHDYYLIVPIFVCAVTPFENSVNMNTPNKENNFKFYICKGIDYTITRPLGYWFFIKHCKTIAVRFNKQQAFDDNQNKHEI